MIISISGTPGSGKSTLAKMLAEKLGWERHYIGGMRREIARRHNLTLEELNKLGEAEDWTDREVDSHIVELGKQARDMIIESRTAFFLLPQSLKVFIDVAPRVGAERVFAELQNDPQTRNEGSNLVHAAAVEQSHAARMASDSLRLRKYYGVDIFDRSRYDVVLDTTNLTISQAFVKLWELLNPRLSKPTKT